MLPTLGVPVKMATEEMGPLVMGAFFRWLFKLILEQKM